MTAGSVLLSSISPRTRYLAATIHAMGPRPLYECICDLIVASSGALDIIERYAGLQSYGDFIAANGGRELPPIVHLVK
jgi:hypothetical protein